MRHGRRWGRCLLDSTIFKIREPVEVPITRCPSCERAWEPVDPGTTLRELKKGGWNGAVDCQIDYPALKNLLCIVRADVRATGPSKIECSGALKQALSDCSDVVVDLIGEENESCRRTRKAQELRIVPAWVGLLRWEADLSSVHPEGYRDPQRAQRGLQASPVLRWECMLGAERGRAGGGDRNSRRAFPLSGKARSPRNRHRTQAVVLSAGREKHGSRIAS